MAGFGEQLRVAREGMEVSLGDISQETKISRRVLEALEAEDFEQLPGGVFAVSFLRQYASRVGLDPDPLVSQFKAKAPASEPMAARDESPVFGEGPSDSPLLLFFENVMEMASRNRSQLWSAMGFLGLLALIAAYFAWRGTQDLNALMDGSLFESPPVVEVEAPPEGEEGDVTADAGENVAAAPVARPPQPPRPQLPPRPVRVRFRTKADVWVRVRADGRQLFEQVVPGDSERTIGAERFITMLVGDAGQVEVSWNGEDLEPMGDSGQVRNFVYTPRGKGPLRPKTDDGGDSADPPAETGGQPARAALRAPEGRREL